MYYVLNSPVITGPGTYRYDLVSAGEAAAWLKSREWSSTVGYEETAKVMSDLFGLAIPVNRVNIRMEPGDEALVFRLVKRLESALLKGHVSEEFIKNNFEIGLLHKLS